MANIITISREFGSGGRELGERLAEKLGYAYFDKEVVSSMMENQKMSEDYIKKVLKKNYMKVNLSYSNSFAAYAGAQLYEASPSVAQKRAIKKIAEMNHKGVVIVGMGADILLKDYNPIKLFVYADKNSRLARCKSLGHDKPVSDRQLRRKIDKIDKARKEYYEELSSKAWGNKDHYHLCINTTGREIEALVKPLVGFLKQWFEE